MVKKIFAVLIAVTIALAAFPAFAFAADEVVFTLQPKGGTVDNYQDFVLKWKTNKDGDENCRYMLQMRESEKYDWGNVDYVTSPYTMNYNDFKQDFRIWIEYNDKDYYSNAVTISWVAPDNTTTVVMDDITIEDLPLGYTSLPTFPVTVKNTGKYNVVSPELEFGEGNDYCEIIENKKPHNIKPGETDSTTWSVRPKKGLGIGTYDSYVYLKSENVAAGTSFKVTFDVVESDVEIGYEISADEIDLGTLDFGYSEQDSYDLVIRSTGTGNLSNVHLVLGDSDTSFFDIQTNKPTIDSLPAGTDTGKNWSVRLRTGLEPGEYSTQIKVFCDELDDPALITVKATVKGDEQSGDDTRQDGDSVDTDGKADKATGDSNGLSGWVIAIIVVAAVLLLAAAAVVVIVVLKKKNSIEEIDN